MPSETPGYAARRLTRPLSLCCVTSQAGILREDTSPYAPAGCKPSEKIRRKISSAGEVKRVTCTRSCAAMPLLRPVALVLIGACHQLA